MAVRKIIYPRVTPANVIGTFHKRVAFSFWPTFRRFFLWQRDSLVIRQGTTQVPTSNLYGTPILTAQPQYAVLTAKRQRTPLLAKV